MRVLLLFSLLFISLLCRSQTKQDLKKIELKAEKCLGKYDHVAMSCLYEYNEDLNKIINATDKNIIKIIAVGDKSKYIKDSKIWVLKRDKYFTSLEKSWKEYGGSRDSLVDQQNEYLNKRAKALIELLQKYKTKK